MKADNANLTSNGISALKGARQIVGVDETQLRAHLDLLSKTLDALSAHVAIIDDAGIILAVNGAWRRFAEANGGDVAGFNIGDNYLEVCDVATGDCADEARPMFDGIKSVIQGNSPGYYMQYPCHTPNEKGWYQVRVTPFTGDMHNRFVISHENITESKIAEEELRASQAQLAHIVRMGTMGELAAGIAHELNQPLTAISNYASGCARRLEGDDLAAQRKAITFALEEIANESERAGIIIRRLREFVRKSDPKRELINLNESLAEAIGLVHHEARLRGVEVTTKLDSSIAMVFGDSIQLQQVLLNLLRNAVEAICGFSMGDAARPEQLRMLGQVMVVTRMPDPQSVIVEVIDDGPGLSIESIERVFEAFYTTKSAGLGLGLSLSASIVEAHGGTLRCGNRTDGGGAWFRMLLPKGHQEASKRPV